MLKASGITKSFGGVRALNRVDFYVTEGEIMGLIGPNGSGKTTLFNVISGLIKADQGKIEFSGKRITGLGPHEICRLGIGRTFQIPHLFLNMTVSENICVAAMYGNDDSLSGAKKKAISLLELVGILEKKDSYASELSAGQCKLLELARALATEPKLLLVDELVAGLSSANAEKSMHLIQRLRDEQGMTIFVIEHVLSFIMKVCERVIVLDDGRKIVEGPPKAVVRDKKVIDAYLGERPVYLGE